MPIVFDGNGIDKVRIEAFTDFRIRHINGIWSFIVEVKTSTTSLEQYMPRRIYGSGVMPSGSQVHKRLAIRRRFPAETNAHVYRQSSKHQTDVKQLVHEETR